MYCRYLFGGEAGTKLYCLVTETHVGEQLAQGRYLAVHRAGIEPAALPSLIPRLHDQAGSTSWLDELLCVSWTSQLDVCSTFARCSLDDCFV